MAEEKKELRDTEALLLLTSFAETEGEIPCSPESIDGLAKFLHRALQWARESEEKGLISQSFTITSRIRLKRSVVTGEEEIEGLAPIFYPSGPDMTPEDCIALSTEGIRWALGAMQVMKAKMRRELAQRQAQGERRIVVPAGINLKQQ